VSVTQHAKRPQRVHRIAYYGTTAPPLEAALLNNGSSDLCISMASIEVL
jgi:hypothetical protein